MSTVSTENYLKTVYSSAGTGRKPVSTASVAKKLGITNAATSEMAKKLAGNGYLSYAPYKGVELTEKGKAVALKVIRRHRLWELFLLKTLDLSWEQVHDEAEILEHSASDFLIDKIDQYLGFPSFDPHGAPIPDADGKLPEMPEQIELGNCNFPDDYKIVRVSAKSDEIMKYFSGLGLKLDESIKTVKKLSFDNSVTLLINNKEITLSEKMCKCIFVTSKKG